MNKIFKFLFIISTILTLSLSGSEIQKLTVKEVFKEYKNLLGKTIKVDGNVTKIMKHVLNKSWIHIKDGTKLDEKRDELKFITMPDIPTPPVNSQVTAKGVVDFDKTFGLIIKDATFTIKK